MEKEVILTNGAEIMAHPYAKHSELTPFMKTNSKWITDLKCKIQDYKTSRREHRRKSRCP